MENKDDTKLIEQGSPAWDNLVQLIVNSFEAGDVITHSFLKKQMGIKYIRFEDYETQEDFESALEIRQFAYMGLIDKLRTDILENEKYYIQNVKGEGYRLMPPEEQVNFAYEQAVSTIKKAFSNSEWIMKNTRKEMLDARIAKENADTMVKFSTYRQMVLGMLRKRK